MSSIDLTRLVDLITAEVIASLHGQGQGGAADAANKVAWLVAAARSLGASGVALKDESGDETQGRLAAP